MSDEDIAYVKNSASTKIIENMHRFSVVFVYNASLRVRAQDGKDQFQCGKLCSLYLIHISWLAASASSLNSREGQDLTTRVKLFLLCKNRHHFYHWFSPQTLNKITLSLWPVSSATPLPCVYRQPWLDGKKASGLDWACWKWLSTVGIYTVYMDSKTKAMM